MLPVALTALKEAQHWIMPLWQHADSHRLRPPATQHICLRGIPAAAAAGGLAGLAACLQRFMQELLLLPIGVGAASTVSKEA
jgi:hypothetical protein